MTSSRKEFYDPVELKEKVARHLTSLNKPLNPVDYLTIVPDGEPTLDVNLGRLITQLKTFGIKIAVITNSSLIFDPQVQNDLNQADLVSVKVDAVNEEVWKKIDRPHGKLELEKILQGILTFADGYKGTCITETMLIKDFNDQPDTTEDIAEYLVKVNPDCSYISIPTRPPAEAWVSIPDEKSVNTAFQIFSQAGLNVEYLIGYEGNDFAFTGDIRNDLLSITSVHPMREDAVEDYLIRAGGDQKIIDQMLIDGDLLISEYQDKRFYLRKFK
jgi:wyosine [tRNA(Phe)-imidazoG37] synthetase (radical SAM superfamily)